MDDTLLRPEYYLQMYYSVETDPWEFQFQFSNFPMIITLADAAHMENPLPNHRSILCNYLLLYNFIMI